MGSGCSSSCPAGRLCARRITLWFKHALACPEMMSSRRTPACVARLLRSPTVDCVWVVRFVRRDTRGGNPTY
eukprot:3774501-Prymnesium_polylepis.2